MPGLEVGAGVGVCVWNNLHQDPFFKGPPSTFGITFHCRFLKGLQLFTHFLEQNNKTKAKENFQFPIFRSGSKTDAPNVVSKPNSNRHQAGTSCPVCHVSKKQEEQNYIKEAASTRVKICTGVAGPPHLLRVKEGGYLHPL